MVTYLEVELDGVRAATVDTESPMKTVRSLNPVVFAIASRPAPNSGRLLELAADTSLVGSSDYIQPRDARIARLAVEVAGASGDTLVMARALNRWVYTRIAKDSAAVITRSVDVLRAMRGGRDEHHEALRRPRPLARHPGAGEAGLCMRTAHSVSQLALGAREGDVV
jgi:hypothetical protein